MLQFHYLYVLTYVMYVRCCFFIAPLNVKKMNESGAKSKPRLYVRVQYVQINVDKKKNKFAALKAGNVVHQ